MQALVGLALAVLAVPQTEGQATWGGLRFGMTPEEVKAVLGDRAKAGSPSKDAPPDELTLEVSSVKVGDVAGTGRLIFAGSPSRLKQVSLDFTRAGEGHLAHGYTVSEQLKTVQVVSDQLVEKYGKPTIEKGTWPSSKELTQQLVSQSMRGLEAERMWKTSGQIIKEWLRVLLDSVFLIVSYKPVDAESEI